MTRTDIMSIANEIHNEWMALDNEWIDKPSSIKWESIPGRGSIVRNGHWKKEMSDELKRKIGSLMVTLSENFAPVNFSVATDELRRLFKRGGMKSVDWKKCDDQTFSLFVLRNLTVNYGVPIASCDDLIAESWNKFFETFGDLVSDASRTPQESAEYHQGIANLKEWREGGMK